MHGKKQAKVDDNKLWIFAALQNPVFLMLAFIFNNIRCSYIGTTLAKLFLQSSKGCLGGKSSPPEVDNILSNTRCVFFFSCLHYCSVGKTFLQTVFTKKFTLIFNTYI